MSSAASSPRSAGTPPQDLSGPDLTGRRDDDSDGGSNDSHGDARSSDPEEHEEGEGEGAEEDESKYPQETRMMRRLPMMFAMAHMTGKQRRRIPIAEMLRDELTDGAANMMQSSPLYAPPLCRIALEVKYGRNGEVVIRDGSCSIEALRKCIDEELKPDPEHYFVYDEDEEEGDGDDANSRKSADKAAREIDEEAMEDDYNWNVNEAVLGYTPLMIAISQIEVSTKDYGSRQGDWMEIVNFLMDHPRTNLRQVNFHEETALMVAIRHTKVPVSVIDRLLEKDPGLAKIGCHSSPISQYLCATPPHRKRPPAEGEEGYEVFKSQGLWYAMPLTTPARAAAFAGRSELISRLMALAGDDGRPPIIGLKAAIESGSAAQCRRAIEEGKADCNAPFTHHLDDSREVTPLGYAIMRNEPAVVEYLLTVEGIDANACTKFSPTIGQAALEYSHCFFRGRCDDWDKAEKCRQIMELLIKRAAPARGSTEYCTNAADSDDNAAPPMADRSTSFSSSFVNLDAVDFRGLSALHLLASEAACNDVIKLLLDAGAEVNVLNVKDGRTPIFASMGAKYEPNIDIFLKHPRIDLDVITHSGASLLNGIWSFEGGVGAGIVEKILPRMKASTVNNCRRRRQAPKRDRVEDGEISDASSSADTYATPFIFSALEYLDQSSVFFDLLGKEGIDVNVRDANGKTLFQRLAPFTVEGQVQEGEKDVWRSFPVLRALVAHEGLVLDGPADELLRKRFLLCDFYDAFVQNNDGGSRPLPLVYSLVVPALADDWRVLCTRSFTDLSVSEQLVSSDMASPFDRIVEALWPPAACPSVEEEKRVVLADVARFMICAAIKWVHSHGCVSLSMLKLFFRKGWIGLETTMVPYRLPSHYLSPAEVPSVQLLDAYLLSNDDGVGTACYATTKLFVDFGGTMSEGSVARCVENNSVREALWILDMYLDCGGPTHPNVGHDDGGPTPCNAGSGDDNTTNGGQPFDRAAFFAAMEGRPLACALYRLLSGWGDPDDEAAICTTACANGLVSAKALARLRNIRDTMY